MTEDHKVDAQVKAKTYKGRRILISLLGVAVIISLAMFASKGLARLKKEPAKVEIKERSLRVEVLTAKPEDLPITIKGYGETRALNVVAMAPEVGGRVVAIHARLEMGEVIPAGELLFRIDPRDYEARLAEAAASTAQLGDTIKRLERQYAIDRDRLKTLERSRDLAQADYRRAKELLEKDQVGTQSGVDQVERGFNTATDQARLLAQAVELYPTRISEARNGLAAAQARQGLAQVNLERTECRAPFTARIKSVDLEENQYVTPGRTVLTLADDSVLEISVPLDSRVARQWLCFGSNVSPEKVAWFSTLAKVPCKISWTEDKAGHTWSGTLHRVEQFDPQSRTLTVAVRINGADAMSQSNGNFPLVEGMYCQVDIPGQTLKNAFRLPASSVSFAGTVYVAVGDRLKTIPVTAPYSYGQETFVSEGLEAGDRVIVTRLVNPLENSLLEVVQ